MNPRRAARAKRRRFAVMVMSVDVDLQARRPAALRHDDGQHAVDEIRGDVVGARPARRSGTSARTGPGRARAAGSARGSRPGRAAGRGWSACSSRKSIWTSSRPRPGQLDGEEVPVRQLRQVHRRHPARRRATEQALETLLHGEQVAHRIPGHTIHDTTPIGGAAGPMRAARVSMVSSRSRGESRRPMSSIQATRLRKGMLIKHDGGLLPRPRPAPHHAGQQARHVQCKMRDIRTTRLIDHKFRAEDDVERAIARRARDAVPLPRRRHVLLHEHGDLRAGAPVARGARRQRALPAARVGDQRRVLRDRAGGHPPAADRRPEGRRHRARASRARRRPRRSSRRRSRPGWWSTCRRSSTRAT